MYKITLKNTWLHFKKVCTHKFWVAYYCFKAGLYWRGIMHDMSKFSWIEFWESVKYYQGDRSPINACKEDKGYSLAWQHHKGRNPHHYEYWTDKYDDGTIALEMPYNCAVELVCDWVGAGRAYFGKDFTFAKEWEWWRDKIENRHPKINQQTANFVDHVFWNLKHEEELGKADPFDEVVYGLPVFFNMGYKYDRATYEKIMNDYIKEHAKADKRLGKKVKTYYNF